MLRCGKTGFARQWLALLFLAAASCPAHAEGFSGPDRAFITGQVENDLFANFANTDRHYTNGLQLSYLSEPRPLPGWLGPLRDLSRLGLATGDGVVTERLGIAIGHSIFTPDDTDQIALIPDDRPYAGYLHLTFTAQSVRVFGSNGSALQDQWKLDLGVVGPAAGGKFVQNEWHQLIGAEEARGWDNQLHNEPAINLTVERAWRSPALGPSRLLGLKVDAIPYGVVALGNVQTYAGVGGMVRLGPDLARDFGPPRIYPGVGGSEWFVPADGFDWYLFAGAEGRAVAHNIFLDGNTFRDSHSVNKRHLVADLRSGAVFTFHTARLSLTHVYRTKEYSLQPKADQFGSITLSIAY